MGNIDYKASEDSVGIESDEVLDSSNSSTIHDSAGPTVDSQDTRPSANDSLSSNMALANFSAAAASIVIPLYQYPLTETTWAPLYNAIERHPQTQFVVIINPNSGPGDSSSPDASYSNEIPRLNAKTNVQTIGYVRTDYCRRDVADVIRDVEVYSGWPGATANEGIHVNGIFFDETPNAWSEMVGEYLDQITDQVKQVEGIQGGRLVMHNPGTVPDERMAELKPEVTAVFEQAYAVYRDESVQESLTSGGYERTAASIIVHSTPIEEIKGLVDELKVKAEYLFVTDLQEDYYQSFGASWDVFVDAVAGGAGEEINEVEAAAGGGTPVEPVEAEAATTTATTTGSCGRKTRRSRSRSLGGK